MKYIYIINDTVIEIIPDFDPALPNIPISDRYSAEFLSSCIEIEDSVEVLSGYLYDAETKVFSAPVVPEPPEPPEPSEPPSPPEPTEIEQLQADNKKLKAQVTALSDNQDFYENCIVEMATIVYA